MRWVLSMIYRFKALLTQIRVENLITSLLANLRILMGYSIQHLRIDKKQILTEQLILNQTSIKYLVM